ncbi:MAG: hypothetical protein R3F61_03415 [Myxococcota bacterium]
MTALLLILGCTPIQTGSYQVCDLTLSPEPAAAFPGETVVVTGGPLSAAFDLHVTVAGIAADVQSIERTECDACDQCLLDNDCLACGTCLPCTQTCSTCVETTTLVVPDAPPGDTRLSMVNVFGTGVAPFRVRGLHTGSTGDTAVPDTDLPDTAQSDTSTPDTDTDTDTPDTGADTQAASTADTGASAGDTSDTSVITASPTGSTADTGQQATGGGASTADTGGGTGTP